MSTFSGPDQVTTTVFDTMTDLKAAKLIETRLANYIMKRVAQEQAWDQAQKKFGPRYADGEVYLRRCKSSASTHALNVKRSAESGINLTFAKRLNGLNLALRFKPKY